MSRRPAAFFYMPLEELERWKGERKSTMVVYAYVRARAGRKAQIQLGQDTIADRTGYALATVEKAIRRLKDLDLIAVHRTRRRAFIWLLEHPGYSFESHRIAKLQLEKADRLRDDLAAADALAELEPLELEDPGTPPEELPLEPEPAPPPDLEARRQAWRDMYEPLIAAAATPHDKARRRAELDRRLAAIDAAAS